jgi:xanthine dehydrogenase accessory factor
MESMQSWRTAVVNYDLTGRKDTPEGLICGGTMEILVEPIRPGFTDTLYGEIVRIKHEGGKSVLATVVPIAGAASHSEKSRLLVREDESLLGSLGDSHLEAAVVKTAREVAANGRPALLSLPLPEAVGAAAGGFTCEKAVQVFVEPITPQPAVYIFGAGHIGFAVSRIAKMAGFRIVVIDDRPAYANSERFPDADEFHVEDPADAVSHLNINKASYLVIACRGHLEDQRVLAEALKTKAGYIGMIGSRKKTKTVFANLMSQGVSQEALDTVHSPIGLPIATETPEEIAVSIMAEIIDVRRRKNRPRETIMRI